MGGDNPFGMRSASTTATTPSMDTLTNAQGVPLRLPQELVENILDLLEDDSNSLKSSSLVCRSWQPRSQYRLHRVLNLRSDCNLALIRKQLTPVIAGYVTSLKLDLSGYTPGIWNSLAAILRLLPYIDTVSFVCKDMCRLRPEVTSFFAQTYPDIGALTISNIIFTNFTEFAQLLNSFPHLHSLEVSNVYWGNYIKSVIPIPKPTIHTLCLAYCTEQTLLLEWLLSENDEGQIASIPSFDIKWHEDIESFEALACRMGNRNGRLVYQCSVFTRYTTGMCPVR